METKRLFKRLLLLSVISSAFSHFLTADATGAIEEIHITGITTNLSETPVAGDSVTFTANAIGPTTIYYKFLYKAGYGTAAYASNQWVTVQNFSATNIATISFPNADNYVVIVQASDDPNIWNVGDAQGGITLEVFENGGSSTTSQLLRNVRFWGYQILGIDEDGAVDALVNSKYDMLVIEPHCTDWSEGPNNFDTKGMVNRLKASTGHDGQTRKLVIAYVDIGEAEDWRWYWTWSTQWQPGQPFPADWPDFIVGADPDGWVGNYPVAYWDEMWQDIMIYGQNTGTHPDRNYVSAIDELIIDGFDGIYLDWVEGFEDAAVIQAAQAEGLDPAQEMIEFISDMRTYARQRNPNFLVIQQNAAALSEGRPNLYNVIDAIAQEEIWFGGVATEDWNDPDGYDLVVDATLTSEYLTHLSRYQQAGLPVFCCEYALLHADTGYANAAAHNIIPYCTRRSLSQLTTTPPPGY